MHNDNMLLRTCNNTQLQPSPFLLPARSSRRVCSIFGSAVVAAFAAIPTVVSSVAAATAASAQQVENETDLLPVILGRPLQEEGLLPEEALDKDAPCEDGDVQCRYWAAIGECEKNPKYMKVVCRPACRTCPRDIATRLPEKYVALEQSLPDPETIGSGPPRVHGILYDPRAMVFDDFITDAEAEQLKALASPHLHKALTINQTTGAQQVDRVRTNSQMYMNHSMCHDHHLVSDIIRRMYVLARIPWGHGEPLQVGLYREGQFYEPHFDSELAQGLARTATVILYLDAPEEGGETIFPKRRQCHSTHFSHCCKNLSNAVGHEGAGRWVTAKKRQALLFYSHDADGRHNTFAIHGACPVRSGNKWIAQQWFRSRPYSGSPHFQDIVKPPVARRM